MTDPVEIVAQTLYDEAGVEYPEDPQVSRCVLSALREDGWRIVRTEPAGLWDHPDHVRPLYEDEDHDGGRELFLITEEWTP